MSAPRAAAKNVPDGSPVGTETISASVPKALVAEVRERIGPREFSQFVARSMQRELLRLQRLAFVADVESASGALRAKELAAARKLLRE